MTTAGARYYTVTPRYHDGTHGRPEYCSSRRMALDMLRWLTSQVGGGGRVLIVRDPSGRVIATRLTDRNVY